MSIILSDFIDENNIELSSKEIRFALKKIYNIEEEYNYHKVLEDFYKISEKTEHDSNQHYRINENLIKQTRSMKKKEDKSYKNKEEVIQTYSSVHVKVAA